MIQSDWWACATCLNCHCVCFFFQLKRQWLLEDLGKVKYFDIWRIFTFFSARNWQEKLAFLDRTVSCSVATSTLIYQLKFLTFKFDQDPTLVSCFLMATRLYNVSERNVSLDNQNFIDELCAMTWESNISSSWSLSSKETRPVQILFYISFRFISWTEGLTQGEPDF